MENWWRLLIALGLLIGFVAVYLSIIAEAERKLGRPLTSLELIVGAMNPAVAVLIVLLLPDRSKHK